MTTPDSSAPRCQSFLDGLPCKREAGHRGEHDPWAPPAPAAPREEPRAEPRVTESLSTEDLLRASAVTRLQAKLDTARRKPGGVQITKQDARRILGLLTDIKQQPALENEQAAGGLSLHRETGQEAPLRGCPMSPTPTDLYKRYVHDRIESRPDDQENVGADELRPVATSLPTGGSTAVRLAAKTDNGVGVTSAGGESGLPHRLEGQPDWLEKFITQAINEPWSVSPAEMWLVKLVESLRTELASARGREPTRVDQVQFGCWPACLAGLTDIPHEAFTRHIPQNYGFQHHDETWTRYHNAIVEELHVHGWTYLDAGTRIPRGFSIACGPSLRGVDHAVIALDGKLWHDPHPSRAGLLSVTTYETVVPICGLLSARTATDGST